MSSLCLFPLMQEKRTAHLKVPLWALEAPGLSCLGNLHLCGYP